MPRKVTSGNFLRAAASNSSWKSHGSHHDPQKCRTTGLPARASRETCSPSMSVSVKSGAGPEVRGSALSSKARWMSRLTGTARRIMTKATRRSLLPDCCPAASPTAASSDGNERVDRDGGEEQAQVLDGVREQLDGRYGGVVAAQHLGAAQEPGAEDQRRHQV